MKSAPTKTVAKADSSDNGGKWYVKDETTKRAVEADSGDMKAEIDAMKSYGLPDALLKTAIAGIVAKYAPVKPFALTIARAAKEGRMDLIEVAGGFKSKQLSPNVLREIASNAEFVLAYLDGVFMADDE